MIRVSLDSRQEAAMRMLVRGLPVLDPILGPWVAGGSVRSIVMQGDLSEVRDVDVWFANRAQADACQERFLELKYTVMDSPKGTATYTAQWGRIIQLVLSRHHASARDLLDSFSITACQFVTDGHTIWAGDQARDDAFNKVFNIINRSTLSTKMVTKYLDDYGYTYDGDIDALLEMLQEDYEGRQA